MLTPHFLSSGPSFPGGRELTGQESEQAHKHMVHSCSSGPRQAESHPAHDSSGTRPQQSSSATSPPSKWAQGLSPGRSSPSPPKSLRPLWLQENHLCSCCSCVIPASPSTRLTGTGSSVSTDLSHSVSTKRT